VPKELDPWFWGDVARAHRHRLDPPLAAGLRHVDRILEKDHGIVVRERNGPAAALHRGFRNRFGRGEILNAIEIAGLRDVPVLAELAGQIAAGSTKRQDRRTRQEVIERLLFNRVDAKA
jgi:hypothetical protein